MDWHRRIRFLRSLSLLSRAFWDGFYWKGPAGKGAFSSGCI